MSMGAIAIILILAGLLYLTFLRPWLGMLALAVFGLLQPHGYVGEPAASWPVYKVLFAGVLLSMAASPEIRAPAYLRSRLLLLADWRVIGLGLLWLLFLVSTLSSLVPSFAWPKFLEFSKVLVTCLLALVLLDTRRKVEWFLFTIAVCIGLVCVKGGFWALMTGSVHRVYGPPGSEYYNSNHFAVLALVGLPLIALLFRRAGSAALKVLLAVVFAVSVVAALTSWSRGGLLGLAATLALLLVMERRLALIPLALIPLALALGLFPEEWFSRMETIGAAEQDDSALGRLGVWREGLDFALRFPLTGAGPDGWVWTATRDWHSAYVEILAEHGFLALGVWVVIYLGTLLSLVRCRFRRGADEGAACGAVFVALAGYGVGAAFLGLSYWEIYYQLLVLSVLLTRAAPAAEAGGEGVAGPVRIFYTRARGRTGGGA